MRIGSLFSGIGGLELGLEIALEAETVWQVEKNKFCHQVLARHWPHATRFFDVRTVGAQNLAKVDLVCGGFPCQDISCAGNIVGITGKRSGLWFEMLRIIGELKPRFVVAENVDALISNGLDTVLKGLESHGYKAKVYKIAAKDVGAPHQRRRCFIVANNDMSTVAGKISNEEQVDADFDWSEKWKLSKHRMVRDFYGFPARLDSDRLVYEPALTVSKPQQHFAKRYRMLGNSVVPQCAFVIGSIIKEAAMVCEVG